MARPYFGAGVGPASPLATIRKASLIAALSEGHPYNSRIRAIASLSTGSRRIVVALACFFLIEKVYVLDSEISMCYVLLSTLKTESCLWVPK